MEDKHTLSLTSSTTRKQITVAGKCSRHYNLEDILQGQSAKPCNVPLGYLQDITNNFSEERELGRGAFGVVYKGSLQNGQVIAVKKLVLLPGIHDKHFENEVYHLMRLKHENIVRIVGYCYEIQHILIEHNGKYRFAEMPQRLLCLELLPEGSLAKHISDESHGLDWHTRYKILVGICRGLHHLHEEWQTGTPIIHLDLKPANILLNENMVPKIADFGLSRLFDPEETRVYTKTLVGSLGYMAPEYLNKGMITIKADIFSLGVIIIEIITGRKDYPDCTGTSKQNFIDHVLQNWRNKFKELKHTSKQKDCKQIKRCIEIGLNCVQTEATKRPTTREIIESLDRWDSEILHVSNEEKSAAEKVNDDSPKTSDLTFNHSREVLRIIKRLKKHGDYFGLTEEVKPSSSDSLCNELWNSLKQGIRNSKTHLFAIAEDSLSGKLLYLENRVALARRLFPMDMKKAMEIAKKDGNLEFVLDYSANPPETQQTTIDLNDTPFKMKEEHFARMRALSKTVEQGKRFFPSCSKVLDRIMEDETMLASRGGDTYIEKKKRVFIMQDALQKAFCEDKEQLDRLTCSSFSLSTTIGAV